MAWIESHQALREHPKVLRLSRAAGWSIPETIGKLQIFWWWCLDYATDGRLDKFDHSTIAHVFGVSVEVDQFVHTLIEIGFLDSEPEIRVHDWWDYAGRFLQIRYKRTPKIWKEIKRFYGHAVYRNSSRTTTEQQPKNNHKPNQLNLTNLTRPNQTKPISCASPSASAQVWNCYAEAYRKKYQTDPVRNAKVNGQFSQLVKRIGEDAAPSVAAFYVWHNDQFYVRARHPPGLLLRDCEGLHTQWKTGQSVTSSQARKIDETQGRVNVFQELINERKGGV